MQRRTRRSVQGLRNCDLYVKRQGHHVLALELSEIVAHRAPRLAAGLLWLPVVR